MAKVYVVTEGEYSAYHICAMFSERPLAELYIQTYTIGEIDTGLLSLHGLENAKIEEWDIDPDGPQLLEGYSRWHIIMDRNGNIDGNDTVVRIDPAAQYDETPMLRIWSNECEMECYVLAKSAEHAVKIANEKRTRIIAENNWRAGYTE